MTEDWKARPEGGAVWAIEAMVLLMRVCGRMIGVCLLFPITMYFLVVRGPERRASRQFLTFALGKKPSLWHVARHIYTFARTILDRFFLMQGQLQRYHFDVKGLDALLPYIDAKKGALLFGSHLGSFFALRALSTLHPTLRICMVVDKAHNQRVMHFLEGVNPNFVSDIIDLSAHSGASAALAINEAVQAGAITALLVDRYQPGTQVVAAQFFNRQALFPASPWLIAGILGTPIVLAHGLYRGRDTYEIVFEKFAQKVVLPRADRAQLLERLVQRYALRLEALSLQAPYNWFNFYDFWHTYPEDASLFSDHRTHTVEHRDMHS